MSTARALSPIRLNSGTPALPSEPPDGNFPFCKAILLAQSAVAVYYDPNRPVNAALIPGADETGNNVAFICGSILLLAGIWGFFKTLPWFGAPGQATPAPQAAGAGRVSPHDRTI